MTTKVLLLTATLTLLASACESSPAGQNSDAGGTNTEAGPDACDHDGCIVPIAELSGRACPPTLDAAKTDCPGVIVDTGPCGELTHVRVTTANPIHDCFYDTTTGELVGGIGRSDSGFTKVAGFIPIGDCPATTRACDHTPL
jgi:hypothetical protein